jgi:7-carboxy-7-deazaguanine synthase (Cx14CxxC type)
MSEYHINEIFYTIQGEGYWTGRAAVFVRFSRCNLWTGREADRARADCQFCDTDFVKSEKLTDGEIVERVTALWPKGQPNRMIVFTGGEPALQLDNVLMAQIQPNDWYTAIETNGTAPFKFARGYMDWVCVSPKSGTDLRITEADELKVVWPQAFEPDWLRIDAKHHWLSPMDGPNLAENTAAAVDYVLAHPHWRLNIQTHKVVGLP